MNNPSTLTGIYSFAKHDKYGPSISLQAMQNMFKTVSLSVLRKLFLDIAYAHPKTSIIIDIDAGDLQAMHFLQDIGAEFRFKNPNTLIEQWIIINGSGAPIGPNSRIGIMVCVTIIVNDIIYYIMVKERFGSSKYKFITGGVEENPITTVYKELFEEVGIITDSPCTLCGTMYNPNQFPEWNTKPIQDICLLYAIHLGIQHTLPQLTPDTSEIIDAIWYSNNNLELELNSITHHIIAGDTQFFAQGYDVLLNFNPLNLL